MAYSLDTQTGLYSLQPIGTSPVRNYDLLERTPSPCSRHKTIVADLAEDESAHGKSDDYDDGDYKSMYNVKQTLMERTRQNHSWCIPGHPGDRGYTYQAITSFQYDPKTMPPPSHILRSYSSSAVLYKDAEPALQVPGWWPGHDGNAEYYKVIEPQTKALVGRVLLNPSFPGIGRRERFVYISRALNPISSETIDDNTEPEMLHLIILQGDGPVKTKLAVVARGRLGNGDVQNQFGMSLNCRQLNTFVFFIHQTLAIQNTV